MCLVVTFVLQLLKFWYGVSGPEYGCVCSCHVNIHANLGRISFGGKNEVEYLVSGSEKAIWKVYSLYNSFCM